MSYEPSFSGATISTLNSSTTNLAAGNSYTFTGTAEQTRHSDIMVNLYADQATAISIQFSQDGTNWDSSLSKVGAAGFNEFTTGVKGARYIRVIVTTASLTTTAFRLQTQYGVFRQGNSPLNGNIGQDSDSLVVRSITEEFPISQGKFVGYSIVSKFGRNIDTGTVPEDVWAGGGVYTGFPTTAPENLQVFSSSAGDTGVLTIIYLASNTATAYTTATINLTGIVPVDTGIPVHRVHSASYTSGASTTFNLGTITGRHITTITNVFFQMPIGRSQTNISGYTIPAGSTGYLKNFFVRVSGSTSGLIDGALWIRLLNGSPRLRRPFSAANSDAFTDNPYGGLVLTEWSDVIVRVTGASVNNLDIFAGYDIILIKN